MFTTHMVAWKEFFDVKVNADNESIAGTIQRPDKIITSALVLIAHIVGLVGLSAYFLKKKDILS